MQYHQPRRCSHNYRGLYQTWRAARAAPMLYSSMKFWCNVISPVNGTAIIAILIRQEQPHLRVTQHWRSAIATTHGITHDITIITWFVVLQIIAIIFSQNYHRCIDIHPTRAISLLNTNNQIIIILLLSFLRELKHRVRTFGFATRFQASLMLLIIRIYNLLYIFLQRFCDGLAQSFDHIWHAFLIHII